MTVLDPESIVRVQTLRKGPISGLAFRVYLATERVRDAAVCASFEKPVSVLGFRVLHAQGYLAHMKHPPHVRAAQLREVRRRAEEEGGGGKD